MIRHLSRCVGLVFFVLWAGGTSVETTPRRQLAAQPLADVGAGPATAHVARATRLPASGSRAGLNRLPLAFERNEGQVDPSVKFFSRGLGYTLFLTADETVLALQGSERESLSRTLTDQRAGVEAAVRLRLVGANANPRVVGEKELPRRVNHLLT